MGKVMVYILSIVFSTPLLIILFYLGFLGYLSLKHPECSTCKNTKTKLDYHRINSKAYNDEIYRLILLYPNDTRYWLKEKIDSSKVELYVQNDSLCALVQMNLKKGVNFPEWYVGSKKSCIYSNEIDDLRFKAIVNDETASFIIQGYSWIVD